MGMAARVNPFFEPGLVPAEPPAAVRAFHRSLPEYAPTPLHACSSLAGSLGVGELLVKDESWRFGLNAFKALGASWALHRICAARGGVTTVAAATEGNHGRAVAWAARRLGLRSVIFIPSHAAPARIEALRKEGAQVELVPGSYDEAVQRCAGQSAAAGWQVVSDTGYEGYREIPGWIAEGYATLFEEVGEQREAASLEAPEVVLVQAGVGALLHAAVVHFRAEPNPPILVAVEPVAADALFASINSPGGEPTPTRGAQDSMMAGLNCGAVSLTAWPLVRRGVELFLTLEDGFAAEAMRRFARPQGTDPPIIAGETGAAGLGGLLALLGAPELAAAREFLRLGPRSRVMVINTEGATDPVAYARITGSKR
jgi:diaminopropionate ammonia-lyase